MALAGAVNGAPFCRPLSKLCSSSPGDRDWGGPVIAADGPGRGAAGAVGSPSGEGTDGETGGVVGADSD